MTQLLIVDGGTIAYDVSGSGPLIVLAHGLGDTRESYRAVVRQLLAAEYRVATVDLRGCGESSADWPEWSRTAIAQDLLAVIRHLGGPAVLVGHSISGGAATIAAAQEPDLITALVELGPFTRAQSLGLGDLRVQRFRRTMLCLVCAGTFGSLRAWIAYLNLAYPGEKPSDWKQRLSGFHTSLSAPGRMKAMQGMINSKPMDAGAQLGNVQCPVLVMMGSLDPDWADPQAEGTKIINDLRAGIGQLDMIEGAGHYPHHQTPDAVVELMLAFLHEHGVSA